MWVPDGIVTTWSQLTQTVMSKRGRNVWLLAAFSMLLVCLYSYSTVTATEPYLKKSHSSSSGGEGVIVVFANRNNNNNGHTIGNDSHSRSTREVDPRYTQSASATERENVRVKEIPFLSEKQFDITRYIFRRLDVSISGPSDEEHIPLGIQRIIAGDDEEDSNDFSEHNSPSRAKGQPESRPLPVNRNKGGGNVPDWVFSFFFSGDERGGNTLERLESGNDLVYSDLMDIDEDQQSVVPGKGGQPNAKDKGHGTGVGQVPSDTLNPNKIANAKQTFQPSTSNNDWGVTYKQPDLNDPDETVPDVFDPDVSSSTENTAPELFHFTKDKDLTKKPPSEVHTHLKAKPDPVVPKSPLKAIRENSIFKKIFHSLLNGPQSSAQSDAESPDSVEVDVKDVDGHSEKNHGHKKSSNNNLADADLKGQTHKSEVNLTVWKGVLKERKRLLRAKCQDMAVRQSVQNSRALVDHKRNLLYCPVAKSASGFFHRLMFVLKHTNRSVRELPSPFNVSLSTALAEEFDTVGKLHRKGVEELMANSLRFVVVRDPFARLYAAYVDRLLVPDSVFWKLWGIPAISKHRKYPSAKSLTCGHDVTFAEFVKHVIHTLHESDDALKPVNALCAPCDLHFSVIGHIETLVSDIEYILSLLKVYITNFSSKTFMLDVNNDIIWDSTVRAFQFYEELTSCISKYEMGKRLWRNLQIHGIISEELTFSFAPKKVEKMTPSEFVKLVHEARKTLPDSEKVRQQKFQALKTAFENVPAEDIMQLVKIYALDFEYFGYDRHPSFLS